MSKGTNVLLVCIVVFFLSLFGHMYEGQRARNTAPAERLSERAAIEMFRQAQQREITSEGNVLAFDGRSLEILFVYRDPAHVQDRKWQNVPVPERWFIYGKAADGRFISYTLNSTSGKGYFEFIPKAEVKLQAARLGKMDIHASLGGQVLRAGELR